MNRKTTSERLQEFMLEHNMKQVDILEAAAKYCEMYDVKLNRSDISQYVSGKVIPSQDKLTVLSKALDVSEPWLMGYDVPLKETPLVHSSTPSIEWARPIADAYAAKQRPLQEAVCTVLEIPYVAPSEEYAPPEEDICFRISEQHAAAGTGVYLGPEAFYEIYVNVNRLPKGAAFGVPVRGDSMEPKYHDGDILIVSKDEPLVGEIGVFTQGGLGYVKKRGERELISLNPKYDPIPMDDSIRCNGKVVGVLDLSER